MASDDIRDRVKREAPAVYWKLAGLLNEAECFAELSALVDAVRREERATMTQVAAEYVQDRSEQYKQSSGSRVALEDVAMAIRNGDHMAAHEHGELDDLIRRATIRRGRGT